MLAVDAPLMNGSMGLGFSLVHDQIGVSRDLDLSTHYAYHLRISDDSKLAFGLRAGLSIYSANLNELTYWDANDQVFQNNISNQLVGKFGFGLYWYNATSYVGLSVPTIYAADGNITMDVAGALDHYFTQHYYLHAGNLLYKERVWLGVGYRTGDAMVGMVEYQINPQLRIGYAYDMTTSRLRNYTSGSHEVMLGLDLGRELVRIKTPRYF